jgi:para-nitrobenzyl esterase
MQMGNLYASDDAATFDQPYGSEDCLYLNVWTPRPAAAARPVLIFFHGGSGIFGDAAHPLYDGARLAGAADAVVITANYRLGVWGALQSPALQTGDPAEDSGSFFLLDMIRVVDWTRENCAAFGCDANNITISGQSAGAVSVLALLRSPLAKGRFQRAISFSGLPFSASMEDARQRTTKLLTQLLIDDASAAGEADAAQILASKTTEQLRDHLYRKSPAELLRASGAGLPPPYVADGTVLATLDEPDEAAAAIVSAVPLMIGSTRNEMSMLTPIATVGRSARKLWPLVDGEPRDETIDQQLGFFGGIARDIRVTLGNWFVQRQLRKAEREYARKLPAVYVYHFDWKNYPDPWRSELGAFHGLDVPFVFGNFIDDRDIYMRFAWTPDNRNEREALHADMAAAIRAFVHTGDPNDARTTGSRWLAWHDEEYIKLWK